MSINDNDVDKITKCIDEYYGAKLNKEVEADYGWSHPVLNLIDCVLSLNRRYDNFAKPRVKEFNKNNRDVVTLLQLKEFIYSSGGPAAFVRKELKYTDANRAEVLYGVLNRLIEIAEKFPGPNEMRSICQWANSVSPHDYKNFGVFGFGLAGFQYLRMLFGADTVKPDIYIKAFVKDCLGKNVSEMIALYLVETASKRLGYSPRRVDGVIWEDYARNKSRKVRKHQRDWLAKSTPPCATLPSIAMRTPS